MLPPLSSNPACRARIVLLWLLFAVGAALYGSLAIDDPFAVEGERLVELEEPRGGIGFGGDGESAEFPDFAPAVSTASPIRLAILSEVPPRVPDLALLGAATRAPPV